MESAVACKDAALPAGAPWHSAPGFLGSPHSDPWVPERPRAAALRSSASAKVCTQHTPIRSEARWKPGNHVEL